MKRFNINEFMWFIILAGFAAFICHLMLTGRINAFIHPKMHKYMILSFLGFTELALFQAFKIFTLKRREKVKKGYTLFFITLAAGILIGPIGLNAGIAENKGMSLTNPPGQIKADDNFRAEIKEQLNADMIRFNEKNYYALLNEIGMDIEKYKGKKVSLTGFVYNEEGFEKGEFVTARMMMSCCAADAQLVGLMCKWEKGEVLEREQWVRVEGVLDSTVYKDKRSKSELMLPLVLVEKIEKVEKLENPYIYQ